MSRDFPRPGAAAYAALDLGTNNCRMLVAVPARDGFRVVDSFSRIVRLGEGLQAAGALSDVAMGRAIEALQACQARLARHQPLRALRAVATEACRQAGNGPEFLARVRAETGIAFDIISPREEAGLALELRPLLAQGGRRALLFDIGGGSTELAWIRLDTPGAPELIGYASLPLGVVTMAERHGGALFTPRGFATPHGFAAMAEEARIKLMEFERVHRIGQELRQGGVRALGTSGTVTTLAGVALNLVRYRRPLVDGVTLPAGVADKALGDLRGLSRAALAAHPCVGPERVDYVLPGCAIFAAIQQIWAMPEIMVADRGLREGILLRLMRAPARSARAPTPCTLARPGLTRMATKRPPGNSRGVSVRLRTALGRSTGSQRWLTRQLNDPYVRAAQQQGLRSRAAFKLMELDDRFHLIRRGLRCIDLGAAPGGWTQVLVAGASRVVGVDLLAVDPVPGATIIEGDFTDDAMPARLRELLGGPADLVLSDMAPNTTGHTDTDHLRIMGLAELALHFAVEALAPGGAFVAKVFQGGTERTLLERLKQRFATVRHAKPPASRKESSELYVVATGFRPIS